MKQIDILLRASVNKKLSPLTDLPWEDEPSKDMWWMPEKLISIYGEPEYEKLKQENRLKLSQLEFSLLCSVSSSGEKEVISNMASRMLKTKYRSFRRYFYHFIEEENNHIYMFTEFCERYGEFYPILYPYVQGDVWKYPDTGDLLTFAHVLIFEELGQGLNEVMAEDETIPELVRAINDYHVQDEGRHISFGRSLVREFAAKTKAMVSKDEWEKLQRFVSEYITTRHHDYHNVKIYKTVGIENARELRSRLIEKRDENFFVKSPLAERRIKSLRDFLMEIDMLPCNEEAELESLMNVAQGVM